MVIQRLGVRVGIDIGENIVAQYDLETVHLL